jgi:hypothetical protein
LMTRRGMAGHTLLNISILCRAWARSDCVSIKTPPARLMRSELHGHRRRKAVGIMVQSVCGGNGELILRVVLKPPRPLHRRPS